MEIDQVNLLKNISSFLDRQQIPYMLTGALSVVFYGRPRVSHDIDFVIEIHKTEVNRVLNAFKKLSTEYLIQADDIEEAINKKGMFNVIYLPFFTKIDFWLLTDDLFDKERFRRKIRTKILGQNMTLSSPEDTIIQKLRWYQEAQIEKHIVDAAFVYQIQKNKLDQQYLIKWINKLKLNSFFNQLKKIKLDQHI